jgi:lipopolysaccharide biosynthesis glycosyltransferase
MELFDLVVITTEDFVKDIENLSNLLNIKLNILLTSYKDTPEKAMMDRFKIFEYPDIDKYSKLLYLDTDILFQEKLEILFNLEIEDKIYGVIENDMKIESVTHGGVLFDFTKVNKNIPGVNAGALLFKNSDVIKSLFIDIFKKREELIRNNITYGINDQCLLNYFCVTNNLFGNNILSNYIHLPRAIDYPMSPLNNTNIIMNHFYGGGGKLKKIDRLRYHMFHLLEIFKNKKYTMKLRKIKFNNDYIYIDKLTFNKSGIDYTTVFNKDNTKICCMNNISLEITSHSCIENKNLVYFCIINKEYLNLFRYSLISLKIFSELESINLLVLTTKDLIEDIKNLGKELCININTKISDSYLQIFNYENIDDYNKILYLAPDIIIEGNLIKLFDYLEEDKLYKNKGDTGVLLFKNSSQKHQIFLSNLTKDLSDYVYSVTYNLNPGKHIIAHFVWPIENIKFKMDRMKNYLMSLIN